jgi:RimJ/RimL family protein N-acetyltransferase
VLYVSAGTAPARAGWAARRLIQVSRLDAAALRRRLAAGRASAAYQLAFLSPDRIGLVSAFEARLDDRWALAVHTRGGLGAATYLVGEDKLIAALLKLHPGPRHALLTCSPEHSQTLLSSYHLWRPQVMLRMQLDSAEFAPPEAALPVRRLGHADAGDLNRLYALEGDGFWYSGRQIAEGVYYGCHVRGQLVAAAGTHAYSTTEGVGVVGNVFSHPDFRNRGYGSAVTAAVTAHLRERCGLIVLNVDPANRGARRVYEKLGYREVGRILEAMATRREPLSPLPLINRVLARWRSETPGVEVVPA